MGYIKEPQGIDFEVIHKHLSEKEAEEISDFVAQYKAGKAATPVKLEVTATDAHELAFLLELFGRTGVRWELIAD